MKNDVKLAQNPSKAVSKASAQIRYEKRAAP